MNFRLASILSFCALTLTLIIGLGSSANSSTAAPLAAMDEFIYLPYISTPPNLSITNLEFSQSVQDANNGVPLVANRPTVVRVYTGTRNGSSVPGSSVTLTAIRGGTTLSSISSSTMTASAASSQGSLGSTFNVTLPADWLSGTVQVTVKIDGQSGGGMVKTVTFNTVPTLNVVIVPINYTHTPTNVTFPPPATERISDWMMRSYPLSNMTVSLHPSYNFSGNLQTFASWQNLLEQITLLKSNDSALNSTVYYAYINFGNDCSSTWFNCSGGVVGIGWTAHYNDPRTSVGIDLPALLWGGDAAGELAGHEIGHNFGRNHAPCGGPSGVDWPSDPKYAGASIGEYGLDGIGGSLTLLSPSGYVDMMSYCDPVWVSDYTYKALYQDQISNGAYIWAPTQESLLIHGSVADDGMVSLGPVYILPQTVSTPSQDALYRVELLDGAGNIIATHPVSLLVAEEEGGSAHAVHAVVPLPAEPVAALRVVEVASQTAVAQRTLSTAGMSVSGTLAQGSSSATVSWGVTDVPANVRYTANDGVTWTTVGLNVLGGSLEVDLSSLPGGENGRFQIILADQGTPTRLDVNLTTPLADKQPTVWISGSNSMALGEMATLYAFAFDAEDGALADFVWSIDGETVTASTSSPGQAASTLFLQGLSVGEHLVTLTATSSSGQTVSSSSVITVTP